eukprot:gnl/Trimastix_PCT/2332.p1 GENE.gnl/Trimastix_PCT/2332~~gnl/Trimastix_PCT/2332.p1  ORF type:complete len:443 (+),score=98.42 gnl/Trimastix_PCT/2332:88-1329(+)
MIEGLLSWFRMHPFLWNLVFSVFASFATFKLIPHVAEMMHTAGLGGFDLHKPKTVNKKKVPEALGLVPAIGFLAATILTEFAFPQLLSSYHPAILATCFMALLGFVDDVLNLRWKHKIALSALATLPLLAAYNGPTCVVLPASLRSVPLVRPLLDALHIAPEDPSLADPGRLLVEMGVLYLAYMGTVAIFCTNAINIYAGVNGLECGQSVVIACAIILHNAVEICRAMQNTYGTVSVGLALTVMKEDPLALNHVFSLTLMTPFLLCSLALLYYNWYPSRVFVGDTYPYFAGMAFACVGILGHFSKTMMLFFTPQALNFLLSVPQLFANYLPKFLLRLLPESLRECPRHRLPRYDAEHDRLVATPNGTLVNVVLKITGPLHERALCTVLLALQALWCAFAFLIRYPLARAIYHE